jgi:7-cyano-7-deazaguanine synthase
MHGRRKVTGVLVSGGLDSAVLLAQQLQGGGRVWPVYVRCGLVWEPAELHWLRRLLRALRSPRILPLSVLPVPVRDLYRSHWSLTGRGAPGARSADASVYLPGRNLLLLGAAGIAAAERGITRLAVGTLRGNPFSDASPAFFRAMAGVLRSALDRPMTICAPLRRVTKPQLIRAWSHLPLELTFSCLQPSGFRPCGRCNKCAERRRAFRRAGMAGRAPAESE